MQDQMCPGDRVVKFQAFGAEGLIAPAIFHGFFAAILGITHDGVTHVGAVDPKLMSAAGNGMESKFT